MLSHFSETGPATPRVMNLSGEVPLKAAFSQHFFSLMGGTADVQNVVV